MLHWQSDMRIHPYVVWELKKLATLFRSWGGTPLEDAIKNGNTIIVGLLREFGAHLSESYRTEALFAAAHMGDVKVIGLLATSGVKLTVANYDQVCTWTILCKLMWRLPCVNMCTMLRFVQVAVLLSQSTVSNLSTPMQGRHRNTNLAC
jgi:hypothetical protein